MEARLFQLKINFMKQILVIFLISVGSSVHTSGNAQSYSVEKYIAKNYFEKYNSLIEQEFDNFVANEISLGLSQILIETNHVVPLLSNLERTVLGDGSHCSLSSSVRFKLQARFTTEHSTSNSCELVIIEKLPSGVFADPFELQHLVRRGVFTDAAVFGDTNLELPSFRANRSVVEVHMDIASKVLTRRNKDDVEINLAIPLHARYPPLGDEFSRVDFGQPDLLMCCSLERNALNKSCLLMPANSISDEKASPIWEIPCGNKNHANAVSIVTFGAAIVSALLIVVASIGYSDSKGFSRLKYS